MSPMGEKELTTLGSTMYEWKSVRLRGSIILDIFSINPQHALGRKSLGSLNRKQISSKNEQSLQTYRYFYTSARQLKKQFNSFSANILIDNSIACGDKNRFSDKIL